MALTAHVAIVGGGLIGCSAALTLADAGADVVLIAHPQAGAASAAAAGMLAPSMEFDSPAIRQLAIAARDLFPTFVEQLEMRTGKRIELNREGLLEVAANASHAVQLAGRAAPGGHWLNADQVAALEPSVLAPHGAVLWPLDGAVNNTQLLAALLEALRSHDRVHLCEAEALSVTHSTQRNAVSTDDGGRVDAAYVVIAAGAWSGKVQGAPLALAVEPVRGQLVEFDRHALTHVVYGAGGYLVPRGDRTIAGSTMEWVGFDPQVTESGSAMLTAAARALCPALQASPTRAWAGLRPVTPDMLPLLGPDPRNPSLIYACGHSRNGVLLTPMTSLLLKEIIFEECLTFDIGRFRPDRFSDTFSLT